MPLAVAETVTERDAEHTVGTACSDALSKACSQPLAEVDPTLHRKGCRAHSGNSML